MPVTVFPLPVSLAQAVIALPEPKVIFDVSAAFSQSKVPVGGATVIPAEYPDAVRRAWNLLPEDVAVVVLTHEAAAVIGVDAAKREGVITVVMPP